MGSNRGASELPVFFERMLERLPAGAYACDPDGLITWFNEGATRVWGREPKKRDPVDRYCGSFRLFDVGGAPIAHDQCWMALALRENRAFEGHEILIERPSGERAHVLAYANPIHDEAGQQLGAVNVLIDVSEHKRVENALRRSERELDDFFEHGAVGLHWVGGDGRILRANEAELAMLGYEREEYVGHHIAEFHADADVIETILEKLSAGETLRDHPARLRCKDGSIREVQISSNGYFENGELVRTRCFTVDVTEQRRAERTLLEAGRRKDEFLAMLAHELRNPLAPIRNAVEFLRVAGPPEPLLEQTRDLIERQVMQMSRIVDDLLDVARITRGKLVVQRERVTLRHVVENAVEIARPQIDERAHRLDVELPDDEVALDGDPVRLAQALMNLLSNAARYTEPGGRISLRAECIADDDTPRVRIAVRDDGRGIAPEDLGRVFGMFEQGADDAEGTARRESGLGIGLTLVKAFVELHDGRVEARSDGPGHGSEFRIELPVSDAAGAAARPARRAADESQPRRVLVVDDNQDSAVSAKMLLEHLGHSVALAHDGAGALREAKRFEPEVVLLDIGLPDFDGFEVCRRLREQPWGRDALLVAVTGWGQDEHKRRAREAGFDHHLTKPVAPRVLRQFLEEAS